MAGLKDDAQWIVLMGFLVSFSLFFLAMVLSQSVVVGQTTAEAVSEFPKDDIREIRGMIIDSYTMDMPDQERPNVQNDITVLSMNRQNAVVNFSESIVGSSPNTYAIINIHYNNGVTAYNEMWQSP